MDFTKKGVIVVLVVIVSIFLAFFTFEGNMLTGAAIVGSGLSITVNINNCTTLDASGTYDLQNNVNALFACYTISAHNIILDCHGFNITQGLGYVINNSGGFDNITVKDCKSQPTAVFDASNMIAFYFNGSENSTIINNSITVTYANQHGIVLEDSNQNFIGYNNITYGSASGIIINGSSNANTLVNNTLVRSGSGTDLQDILDTATGNNSLIYNNSFGSIFWNSSNLTINYSIPVAIIGVVSPVISQVIFIENGLVGLRDEPWIGNLNNTARIEITGLRVISPSLLKAGTRCDNTSFCNISYNDVTGVLTANVSSFSNYTVQGLEANSTNCGFVIQNITLTKDINVTGTTCFFINASNIILDGAGFTVTGNRTGAGITVNNTVNYLFDNITIRNFGEVRNFTHGFNSSSFNGTIFNNSFNNNTVGMLIRSLVQSNISQNRAVNNSGDGFSITNGIDTGIFNNIFNNTALENGDEGFLFINDETAINIYNNSALNNTGNGFEIQGTEAYRVFDNNAQENGVSGFYFLGTAGIASPSSIVNNEAKLNTGSGFVLESFTDSDSNLSSNTALGNGGHGFNFDSSRMSVLNNTAQGNNVSGFNGNNFFTSWSNNTAHSNKLAGIDINANLTVLNDHYFNNTYDILLNTSAVGGNIIFYNFTNITIDNPSGNSEDKTVFTLRDFLDANSYYAVNYSREPATLPSGYNSFLNKFIKIVNISGASNINNVSLLWFESELTDKSEAFFSLWIYNGSWSLLNDTPSTSENSLNIANLSASGTLAILTNESVAPVQNTGGTTSTTTSTTTGPSPTAPAPTEPSAPSEPSVSATASAAETADTFESGESSLSVSKTSERAITTYTSEHAYKVTITNNFDKKLVLSGALQEEEQELPLENEENVKKRLKEELLLEGEVDEAALEKELSILKLLESVEILQVYKTKLSHLLPASLVGSAVSIPLIPTGKRIEANLLRDLLLNAEELQHFEVAPGETIEKEVKIRRGLNLKQRPPQIIFSSGGEQVLVKELENHEELVTGTAVDFDVKTKNFDFYIIIPPQKQGGKEIFTVEMNINVKKSKVVSNLPLKVTLPFFFDGESKTIFSELYGPYRVNLQRGALLAVQYDASAIPGDYEVVGKVYKKGTEKIAENIFEIKQ